MATAGGYISMSIIILDRHINLVAINHYYQEIYNHKEELREFKEISSTYNLSEGITIRIDLLHNT